MVTNRRYSLFTENIDKIVIYPKDSKEFKRAQKTLQKVENASDSPFIPIRFFVPNWLIEYISESINSQDIIHNKKSGENHNWRFSYLRYIDFYNYLSKFIEQDSKYISIYEIIKKALEYSGLEINNPREILTTEIKIFPGTKKHTNFRELITKTADTLQTKNPLCPENKEPFARFVLIEPRNSSFLSLKNPATSTGKKISVKYLGGAYPIIALLAGIPKYGENDFNLNYIFSHICDNFNGKLSAVVREVLFKNEKNIRIMKEGGCSYRKIGILTAVNKIHMDSQEMLISGIITPMNLEKTKRYNLNEFTCNPVLDAMLRSIDERILDMSNEVNRSGWNDITRARYLTEIGLLYALRTSLYYQVNPKDVVVLREKVNNSEITLYDIILNLKKLKYSITRRNLPQKYMDTKYKDCVRFDEFTTTITSGKEKLSNSEIQEIKKTNAINIFTTLTGLDVTILDKYVNRMGSQNIIGVTSLPRIPLCRNSENKAKYLSENEFIKILRLGLKVSEIVHKVISQGGITTRDITTNLTLQLIGHHGTVHPLFKTIISLINNYFSTITTAKLKNKYKNLKINYVELLFIKSFYIEMQIEKLITDILRCNKIPHEKKERLFELVTTETKEIEEFIGSNLKLYMLKKTVRSILEMWKSYENL